MAGLVGRAVAPRWSTHPAEPEMGGRQGGLGTALMSESVVMLKEGIR